MIECRYGPSPDKPTILLVTAAHGPTFVIHAPPRAYKLLQSIFDKATDMLNLKQGKQLVYRGESMAQVCERLRLEIMRSTRHQWAEKEQDANRAKQDGNCECGVELTDRSTYEIDHVVRLCYDGKI